MVLHETTMENTLELCTKTCRKDSKWICLIFQETCFRTIFCTIRQIYLFFHETTIWICLVMHENVLFCNGKTLVIYVFLHETDANHNGLHTGTDISEITKSEFVWFCKKAPQLRL